MSSNGHIPGPYELSDCLGELSRYFGSFPGGLEATAESVQLLSRLFGQLCTQAQDIENEVQRLRWNDRARRDADRNAEVAIDVSQLPGNVLLFPPQERPFGDSSTGSGPWPGGAA